MSFRKRNIGISSSSPRRSSLSTSHPSDDRLLSSATATKPLAPTPGVRPSPLDGRPTTSTGTPSLDAVLAGHAGLALGNSLLIEELGTTDYAGALLRYYAAEGLVQGHTVHVVGVGEQWGRELPGLVGAAETHNETDSANKEKKERMKIAWRYERLGEFGSGAAGPRGGIPLPLFLAACVHNQHLIIHSRSAQTASSL
jgi:elongator complex protein 4